jgi:thiol-disulfide isomerase/thioredoxin
MKTRSLLALAVLALFTLSARADLGIGDPAPKLDLKFVKGEAVKELKPGQIYVVEFWATWCGPCKATIPHLTKLQKLHGDKVTFIGVAVFEQDQKAVAPFVKEMGDKMEYRVALDNVGDKEPNEGPMAKNWMDAAGLSGIPAAFIVTKDGKVAWIGHPGQIDKPLEEVVAGTYDLTKAAEKFKKDQAVKTKLSALRAKFAEAGNDETARMKVIDEAIKETPELESRLGMTKFMLMFRSESTKPDELLKYGQHLIADVIKDEPEQLNNVAWTLVDPEREKKPTKEEQQLALKAAQQADTVAKGQTAHIADTLARAYFVTGDAKKALEVQERAYKLGKGGQFEEEISKRLEEYRKAAK